MGARIERLTLQLYALARRYAKSRGIILADTKFELGVDADGAFTLGDEALTPDSSRFWDLLEWERSQKNRSRRSPTAFDKQFVREWGKGLGIDKCDPASDRDVAWVHAREVPAEVLARTTQLYRYIFWRLTGQKLERFQYQDMGLPVAPKPIRIEVLSGGGTLDQDQMVDGLDYLRSVQELCRITARRHVVSWQDNPEELRAFAHSLDPSAIVIAGGRKVTALPGILRSHLVAVGKSQVPVIGVAFEGDNAEENHAARLAIECLPGRPVILDPDGKAYFGAQGFKAACIAAVEHEFLPAATGPVPEPAVLDIPL